MSHGIVLESVKRGRSRNCKEELLRSSDSVESSCATARAVKSINEEERECNEDLERASATKLAGPSM